MLHLSSLTGSVPHALSLDKSPSIRLLQGSEIGVVVYPSACISGVWGLALDLLPPSTSVFF